jgi:hypothetical protein
MSVTVVGDGTLHYFKGGEWRALLDRPRATGGFVTLIEDGGEQYWCHIFRASDDFISFVGLTVEASALVRRSGRNGRVRNGGTRQ